MKKIAIVFIDLYQKVLSNLLKNILGVSHFCRFRPTCSDYAKISIKKNGVLKGSYLSILRVMACNPFNKNYDRSI